MERAELFEHWLHSGHRPQAPALPFTVVAPGQAASCDVCHRPVRAGGRIIRAEAADGRPGARLCLPCGRRTILAWSDARRREVVAARQLARDLAAAGPAPVSAAA